MKFFGPHTACRQEVEQVITPVGESCAWCETPIEAHDRGYMIPCLSVDIESAEVAPSWQPFHIECYIRSIVGSIGHQLGKCHCHGGDFEDRPGRTKREAALDAYLNFINRLAAGRQ